jgi:hypothetical protein
VGYDVYLYPRRVGQSWDEVMQEVEERVLALEGSAALEGPTREAWERAVARVSNELAAVTRFDAPHVVELTDEATLIQVQFFAGELAVAAPFWRNSATAADGVQKMWKILEILRDESGWEIYDPQQERTLLTRDDLLAGAGLMDDIAGEIARGLPRDE